MKLFYLRQIVYSGMQDCLECQRICVYLPTLLFCYATDLTGKPIGKTQNYIFDSALHDFKQNPVKILSRLVRVGSVCTQILMSKRWISYAMSYNNIFNVSEEQHMLMSNTNSMNLESRDSPATYKWTRKVTEDLGLLPHNTLPLDDPLVFPAPAAVLLHTLDHKMFPVRRVFCVGRNYRDHGAELGFDDPLSNSETPKASDFIFFEKDRETVHQMTRVPYPSKTHDLQHEVELVVAIGDSVLAESPLDAVYAYAVGVDLARRDLHTIARQLGRPWEEAKSFPFAAPIGTLHPVHILGGHIEQEHIELRVNGKIRQQSNLALMMWKVREILSILTESESLEAGDLVFTGTPLGVSTLNVGDLVCAEIGRLGTVEFEITNHSRRYTSI